VPIAAWFWSFNSGSNGRSRAASDRLAVSIAAGLTRSKLFIGRRKPERDETMRLTMASCQVCRNNGWRSVAAVFESLPSETCKHDKRPVARRLCPRFEQSSPASGTVAVEFIVSLAATSDFGSRDPTPSLNHTGFCFCAASSVSLPRINSSLGERAFAHLPLPRHT
jgi:hypothetical protein